MANPLILTPDMGGGDFGTQMVCRDGTLVAIVANAGDFAFFGDDFLWRDQNGLIAPFDGKHPKDIVARIEEQVA